MVIFVHVRMSSDMLFFSCLFKMHSDSLILSTYSKKHERPQRKQKGGVFLVLLQGF